MLLVKNGRVIDPARTMDATLDVLLDGERIAEVAPAGKISSTNGFEVFDAGGLVVAPGFIDLHAHLREPGQERRSDCGNRGHETSGGCGGQRRWKTNRYR